MYSGAKTGLVTDVQREHQELKNQDQDTTDLGGTNVGVHGPLSAPVAVFSVVLCRLSYLLAECFYAFVQYLNLSSASTSSLPSVKACW